MPEWEFFSCGSDALLAREPHSLCHYGRFSCPITSRERNKDKIQPTATDQEETSAHIAAKCKVDTFLTSTFIAENFTAN